jgi:hypothetical protein
MNLGAGVTTLVADTGVTINNNTALGQYQGGTLIRTASDVWTFQPNKQKILQVVSTAKTDTFSASVASGGTTAITGLSASITPLSATSKILVMASINGGCSLDGGATNMAAFLYLKRDATGIGIGDAAGSRKRTTTVSSLVTNAAYPWTASANFLDAPATTAAIAYAFDIGHASSGTQTMYVNRTATDTDNATYPRSISVITLMEVSA